MGEKNPQFKAFHSTTRGRLSDLPAFRYSEADHSDESGRRVYVVQLTGAFHPLSGPPEIYDEPPAEGRLSIVYDARTGEHLELTFP